MKILRLRPDVTAFGYLGIAPGEVVDPEDLVFDGKSRATRWRPLHVVRPKGNPRGDFFRIGHGSLVLNERAFRALKDVLERSGEFLPLHLQGEVLYLFNCLQVADCLDPEACDWATIQGRRVHIKKYAFRSEAFPFANVFKIPENKRDRVFAFDGRHPPAVELPALIRKHDLKGLVFEEVWDDSKFEV